MRDVDWKDCVDFGYWMFMKIYCVDCGKVVSYSCHNQREINEDTLNAPVKFWCKECFMKKMHLKTEDEIEEYCKGPMEIWNRVKDNLDEYGNEKRKCRQ
jgi:hypothetical protein